MHDSVTRFPGHRRGIGHRRSGRKTVRLRGRQGRRRRLEWGARRAVIPAHRAGRRRRLVRQDGCGFSTRGNR